MKDKKQDVDYETVMRKLREGLASGRIKPDDGNLPRGGYREKSYAEMMEEKREIEQMTDEEIYNSLNFPNEKKSKFTASQKSKLIELLREVQKIQNSNLNTNEKVSKIKNELWTKHNPKTKLLIGGFLGTIFGFAVFGTGGIGIAALGSATGIWGFLAGTTGGILVSSIIQNFEKK